MLTEGYFKEYEEGILREDRQISTECFNLTAFHFMQLHKRKRQRVSVISNTAEQVGGCLVSFLLFCQGNKNVMTLGLHGPVGWPK